MIEFDDLQWPLTLSDLEYRSVLSHRFLVLNVAQGFTDLGRIVVRLPPIFFCVNHSNKIWFSMGLFWKKTQCLLAILNLLPVRILIITREIVPLPWIATGQNQYILMVVVMAWYRMATRIMGANTRHPMPIWTHPRDVMKIRLLKILLLFSQMRIGRSKNCKIGFYIGGTTLA